MTGLEGVGSAGGTGLAAVQARVAELAALVGPQTTGTTGAAGATTSADRSGAGATGSDTADTAGTDFAAALAAALDGSGWDADGSAGSSVSAVVGSSSAAGSSAVGSSSAAGGLDVPTGVTGQDLVDAARAYIGVPYVWGGDSLAEGGLDCSGLVKRSLTDLGVTGVPRVARDQGKLGTAVASLADAQPGDLLVFEGGKHIGIYVGDGQMIDAPRPGKTVQQRDVYETPTAIRRILPAEAPGGSVAAGGSASGSGAASRSGVVGTSGASATVTADDLAAQRALVVALLSGVAA